MKDTVQYVPPALAGRQQRLTDFRQFVEENRKDKRVGELVAVYALNTGLSERTLLSYLKLLVDAKVYRRWGGRLLTPKEFEKARRRNV